MTFILKRGTNVDNHHTSLQDYLNSLPPTSTANYCRLNNKDKMKMFTRSEQNKISADPTWETFDVTLLHKAIKLACENIAGLDDRAWSEDDGSLEGLLTKIKNEKGRIIQELPQETDAEFLSKIRELRSLYCKTLEAAQNRYTIPDKDIAKEKCLVEERINHITTAVPPLNKHDRYKLIELTENPAEAVLRFIIKHGTNTPNRPISLKHYFDELPQMSTANFLQLPRKKKIFTREEREKMSDDPRLETFDLILLCKVIRLGCENVAPLDDAAWSAGNDTLEGLITKLRDERNKIIHDRLELKYKFDEKMKEFEDLYSKLLEAAQERYGIPDQEVAHEKHNVEREIADLVALWESGYAMQTEDNM